MSDLCHDCGQHDTEGCRRWCPNYEPAVIYHHDTPRARVTDPATSHAAAASVTNVTDTQHRILAAYRQHGPMTDEELCQRLAAETGRPVSVSGIRTRRAELVEMGKVHDTDTGKPTTTGRMAIVWNAS